MVGFDETFLNIELAPRPFDQRGFPLDINYLDAGHYKTHIMMWKLELHSLRLRHSEGVLIEILLVSIEI